MEENYKLPKYWCIKLLDSHTKEDKDLINSELNKSLNLTRNRWSYDTPDSYYGIKKNNIKTLSKSIDISQTEITVEDIKKANKIENIFVLPENWYVVNTKENSEVLCKWRGYNNIPIGDIIGKCKWNNGRISKEHNTGGIIKDKNEFGYDFGQEITFEQFKKYVLKEEEFILPEKWCIRQNTSQKVCNWFNKTYGIYACIKGGYKYLLNLSIPPDNYYSNIIPEGYIELSLSQFLKYVLKEDINKNLTSKEGYKVLNLNEIEERLKKHYDRDDVKDIMEVLK